MGYHRAGFEVVGVDIESQPNYPFTFVRGDALEVLVDLASDPSSHFVRGDTLEAISVDAIHASPPCQAYSTTRSLHDREYPDWIGPVRELLRRTSLPYVIENVVGAPLVNPVMLCGSSMGLGVRRHRLFEVSPPLGLVAQCAHYLQPEPIDVTGTGARRVGPRKDGKGGNSRKPRNLEEARAAMGIDWMTRRELSEAVPPVYTEYIGDHLMGELMTRAS